MLYFVIIGVFLFEQLLFKSLTFGFRFDMSIIYHILFSVLLATITTMFCNLFKKKINKIILYTIIIFLCLLTSAQYIYYCIYSSPFSFYSLTQGGIGQAFDFITTILNIMWNNLWFVLFFLPIALFAIFFKANKLHFNISKNLLTLYLCTSLVILAFSILFINLDNKSVDSSYEIYYSDNILLKSNKFGIYTGIILDLKDSLFHSSNVNKLKLFDEGVLQNENIVNNPANGANSDVVNQLEQYLYSTMITNTNKYTNLLKGKNLILIMAESFSPYVIDKNLTPTLYKLQSEGIYFTNFYSPLFPVSTADGEYMALTGLLPLSNTWSLTASSDKYMRFTLANMLKELNYSTYAYHNNNKNYYSRFKLMPNLGFDEFIACPDLKINCNIWPQSDEEMIDATVSNYVNNTNFFVYYESVSGHLPYTINNKMTLKNISDIENLQYSNRVKYYIACQKELDNALKALITHLEKNNILNNTVIAMFSDHYPYGLTSSEISELAGINISDKYSRNKGAFLIWNTELKADSVNILSSNIDITPTLANMFGLNYDSRLLIGNDIFSDTDKIVMFSDQSFITDYVKFNNLTNSYSIIDSENKANKPVDSMYINSLKKQVSNKFKVSATILNIDFYSIISEQ